MAWIKIDDKWANHPKLVTVGPLGKALYMDGLCYAAQYLTDGFIPLSAADHLCLPFAEFKELPTLDGDIYQPIEWLINQGLWEVVDGGYLIHDYLDYNPSRAHVSAERDAARERMKRAREQRANVDRSSPDVRPNFARSSPNPVPVPVPVPVVPSEPNGSSERASETRARDFPAPVPVPHPIPEDWRPEPEAVLWAIQRSGLTESRIEQEIEGFRNHYLANGERMARWDAKWRGWVQKIPDNPDLRPARAAAANGRASPRIPPVVERGSVKPDGGVADYIRSKQGARTP